MPRCQVSPVSRVSPKDIILVSSRVTSRGSRSSLSRPQDAQDKTFRIFDLCLHLHCSLYNRQGQDMVWRLVPWNHALGPLGAYYSSLHKMEFITITDSILAWIRKYQAKLRSVCWVIRAASIWTSEANFSVLYVLLKVYPTYKKQRSFCQQRFEDSCCLTLWYT